MASIVWKVSTRRGIAYVEGQTTAEKIMAATGRDGKLPDAAMAVYTDRKGKTFAYQFPFDLQHWDTISAIVEQNSVKKVDQKSVKTA